MEQIRRYGKFEAAFSADPASLAGNPFALPFSADFSCGETTASARGFYDGDGVWRVRFMPEVPGVWQYVTHSTLPALDGKTGQFECLAEAEGHGPVRVGGQFHFDHADGTPHFSVGTTCYAWIYQTMELQEQTLRTLAEGAFNKIRMCVLPKWYQHNYKAPELYPFEGSEEAGFDYTRPNVALFRLLEHRVEQLGALGIQADLILFHPYEKPERGFNYMTPEQDFAYLRYCIARLSAYQNVWWSLANEWDIFMMSHIGGRKGDPAYWRELGELVQAEDPYDHLRSIHQCMNFYDHSESWITHSSIQRVDWYKTAEYTGEWRERWGKPVVIDECAYEGNNDSAWGNITGEEMTRRFWEGVLRGGYMGHGETYVCPEDILWWSHGGVLKGTSPARVRFLRQILEQPGLLPLEPLTDFEEHLSAHHGKELYLYYNSFTQPYQGHYSLPISRRYKGQVIDTWNMTVEDLPGLHTGCVDVPLPTRPYMLVRFEAVEMVDLSAWTITAQTTPAQLEELPGGQAVLDALREALNLDSGIWRVARKFYWNQPLQVFCNFGISPEQLDAILAAAKK